MSNEPSDPPSLDVPLGDELSAPPSQPEAAPDVEVSEFTNPAPEELKKLPPEVPPPKTNTNRPSPSLPPLPPPLVNTNRPTLPPRPDTSPAPGELPKRLRDDD